MPDTSPAAGGRPVRFGFQIALPIFLVLLAVIFGGIFGGLLGHPCEYCSADVSRLSISFGITGITLVGIAIWQVMKKHWIGFVTVMIGLLPASYYASVLAQRVGLWWDRP